MTAALLAVDERLLTLAKRLEEIPGELTVFRSQFSWVRDELDKSFSRTTARWSRARDRTPCPFAAHAEQPFHDYQHCDGRAIVEQNVDCHFASHTWHR